ncbi:hypothetical protein SERLA73DRAFT_186104 [Serpula lacrymans var. lacrymans S7.3]|uniref:Calcipressin n=2 Tax=Serpula lacrymans var. lacrymans TaxID=341189 RepID=F8Q6Y9_SERL3|nr:uncharacterized protein SERLADRAFT_474970 [Serpula lacrymans var. lacrymans S7.9]EGN96377.1 hypothetical protein SERLA73DRAFT_186104 [Serpula lacrymans var. lacrymans S7.3]EGO21915.1 hypothetical protein SERLADRAFT_474970 [Serpula lacrymans var. lacrymans S7.9]
MPDISILSSSTKGVERTNSIVITQLPRSLFQPSILSALQDHFAVYGQINQWVPIASFSRIIVVYYYEDDAERAKLNCDPLIIEPLHSSPLALRVYRSDTNPILTSEWPHTTDNHYLHPPALEKNFLISPPGSPPIGWEPIKEDPPNATPLADDLIAALRKLQVHNKRSSKEVLLEPEDGVGVGVYVEDCDGEEGEMEVDDWAYKGPLPLNRKPLATAMPPLPAVVS